MKQHVQVAVIGGGVVGCSVLYHLTKLGLSDVVLIERSELTSGSTWHAAGGMHTMNNDPVVSKLQKYTIDLYKEIEELSEVDCGVHRSGGFMLAEDEARLDVLKNLRGMGKYMGIELEFADLSEVAERCPIVDTNHFIAALWDPNEGHVDPWGVTNAYAKSARIGGAEIYRNTKVESLTPRADGGWDITTDKGVIQAEKVVNAAGLWAREVGRMVGIELPVLAMEHHYLITEDIPALQRSAEEMPHCIDFSGEIYIRQEGKGVLLGTYEKDCVPWSPHTTPWDFGHELLEPAYDRIAGNVTLGFEHFPVLEEAGIKKWINGPFTFSPDGNPLVGPVPGLSNFYTACAVMAGFSQGGGVGLVLANWIVNGDPGIDAYPMDVARFGDYTTQGYTREKVREFYSRRFSITYPNEELPAGRPFRTSPIYSRLQASHAYFGAYRGMEIAQWFAPSAAEAYETPTFHRSNAFEHVGREVVNVRDNVGLYDTTAYGRHEIAGPGATAMLDKILANRLPKPGRIALSPMLNESGMLLGDLSIANLDNERYWIIGNMATEEVHQRWFHQHKPDGVTVRRMNRELVGLSVIGPNSRAVMQKLTHEDLSNEAFPFRSIRQVEVGMATPWIDRMTFSGELGYELWMDPHDQGYLYDRIMQAGAGYDIGLCGNRAILSMRMEKGWGAWLLEYRPIYTSIEARMDLFVKPDKGDFIGRDAFLKQQQETPKLKLIQLELDTDIDCHHDEPISHDGKVVGWVTSGGYGHYVKKSLALGYVPSELAEETNFQVEILGEQITAQRLPKAPWDPTGTRMRS